MSGGVFEVWASRMYARWAFYARFQAVLRGASQRAERSRSPPPGMTSAIMTSTAAAQEAVDVDGPIDEEAAVELP